ncbi:MAG: hypothetical protein HY335_04730 [Deinococcus sp.]|nr:hypothetical protein [Deinococcus sp.]
MSRLLGSLSLLALVGCVPAVVTQTPLPPEQPVSFANDIQPILAARCLSCHLPPDPSAGLDLSPEVAYANIFQVPSRLHPGVLIVNPGHPDASRLVLEVAGTPFINDLDLEVLRRWIAKGARAD